MDLYTLSPTFLAEAVVDEFVSAIWTERYTQAGEVQISVPITQYNLDLLAPGTYLGLVGTDEVMIIETQVIEDNLLKASGRTLGTFLDHRFLWAKNPDWVGGDDTQTKVRDYTDTLLKPGQFISDLVTRWAISPTTYAGSWSTINLDWANDAIPYLTLGAVDASGSVQRMTAPVGPLWEAIEQLAAKYSVGVSMYLESADPILGYSLKFKTYQGVDRSSDQVIVPLVRLVPELDGISDIKEVRSNALYKNVCYVYYDGEISEHLLNPGDPEPEGLDRRILVVDAVGEPVGRKVQTSWGGWGGYTQTVIGAPELTAFRNQNALDAFAQHIYVQAIDGQTSPISDYKFGTDYGLGDIIELEGLTGAISKARVTEYIRSQDKSGERSYPTISVIT
jgi:hypothetical protein